MKGLLSVDIEATYVDIRSAAAAGIEKIDGPREWRRNTWAAGIGTFDVSVLRGSAIEKASFGRISLDVQQAVAGPEGTLRLARLDGLQVNIYPANPLLPVALLNLERRELASGVRLA